jgi:hypothetical protein
MRNRGLFLSAVCGTTILGSFVLLAMIGGCGDQSKSRSTIDSNGSESTQIETAPSEETSVEPLLKDWGTPAVVMVLSGEQHGYFEPCGCSERQSGGVSRRADLFRQIKERGWAVTALDLGGTPNSVRTHQPQTRFKFNSLLDAMADMQYEVMAFGPEEIRLGYDNLMILDNFSPEANDVRPSFLSANIQVFDGSFGPRRHKLIEINGIKIGVTSILGKSLEKKAFPAGSNGDVTLNDPEKALPEVIEELKAQKPDLMVLLSHAKLEESRKLAETFQEFDLILSAGGPEDGINKAESIGKAIMVNVGRKGKHVGVVGYFPDDPENRLRFELVELDEDRFADTPKMQDHMRAYQRMLKENYEEVFTGLARGGPHPNGATFVGAEKCGECHTKAYEKWKSTPHANAYESIARGRNEISRTHDPECLSCHVTGWNPQLVFRYDSGFQFEELTNGNDGLFALMKGNQCENCHRPGSRHVELVEEDKIEEAREHVKVTLEFARKNLCYRCHDNDNDPHFNSAAFDEYWEKIKHPWTD